MESSTTPLLVYFDSLLISLLPPPTPQPRSPLPFLSRRKLVDGVEHYIIKDRMRKIQERMKKQRVRSYHTRILSASKPLYSNTQSYSEDTPSSLDTHPGPPPSAMSSGRMSRMSRMSRSVAPTLTPKDSSRSLILSLGKAVDVSVGARFLT